MELTPAPPKPKKGPGETNWQAVVDFAKANPGQWVKVGPYSGGMMSAIKRGLIAPFFRDNPNVQRDTVDASEWIAKNWDITSRTVSRTETTRQVDLYLRYKGES